MHFRCPQMFVHVPSGCLKCSNNMVILRNSHWLSWHSNIVWYSPQTLRLFIWVALSYILFSMQTLCWVFSVLPTVSPLFIFRIKINSVIIYLNIGPLMVRMYCNSCRRYSKFYTHFYCLKMITLNTEYFKNCVVFTRQKESKLLRCVEQAFL